MSKEVSWPEWECFVSLSLLVCLWLSLASVDKEVPDSSGEVICFQ